MGAFDRVVFRQGPPSKPLALRNNDLAFRMAASAWRCSANGGTIVRFGWAMPDGRAVHREERGAASRGKGSASPGTLSASGGRGSASQGAGRASRGMGSASQGMGRASLRVRTIALATRSDAPRTRGSALVLRGAWFVGSHRIAPIAWGIPTRTWACSRKAERSARSSKRIAASIRACSRYSDSITTNGGTMRYPFGATPHLFRAMPDANVETRSVVRIASRRVGSDAQIERWDALRQGRHASRVSW
jgi:hypothetical protein